MKLVDSKGVVHDFVNEGDSWYTKCGALFAKFDFAECDTPTTCEKCKEIKNEECK